MTNEFDPIGESAKSVQEIAKVAGKSVDAARDMGSFISRFISGPLEQASGICEDKLKYLRFERQLRFMKRSEELMREVGIEAPTRAVPLKLAIPLLYGASVEEDDELQDLWAKLLINAGDSQSSVIVQRMFVDILENIGNMEARILETVYAFPFEAAEHEGVLTKSLPESASISSEPLTEFELPPTRVQLAIANLARLGCLVTAKAMSGAELFGLVHPTLLGKSFVEACTLRARAI